MLESAPRPVGLLVVGVHRSGTSALTRTLNLLGATLPEALLGPSVNNPLGHWESERAYELHNALLESIDSRWDDWSAIDPSWFRSPMAERHAHRLAEFLTEEFSDSPLFAIKDPRLCLMAPMWRRAFEMADMDCRAILPLRHPAEVAASLARRNGMPQSKAFLIWLRYQLQAEVSTREMPRCFVNYEDLLTDWRGTLGRVAEALDLGWPRWTLRAQRDIDEFLSPEHRHQVAASVDFRQQPQVPVWVGETYEAVKALSVDLGDHQAMARLDEVRASFDDACKAFWPIMVDQAEAMNADWDRQRHQLKAERGEALREVERLSGAEQALQDRSAEVQRLSGEIAAREDDLNALRSEFEIARAELEQSRVEAENWRGVAVRVAEEIGAKAAEELAAHREEAARLTDRRDAALRELSRLRSEAEQLRRLQAGHAEQAERAASELSVALKRAKAAEKELAVTQKDFKGSKEKRNARIAALEAEQAKSGRALTDLKAQLATLRDEAEALRAAREKLLNSPSWKLTKPVRQLNRLFRGRRD